MLDVLKLFIAWKKQVSSSYSTWNNAFWKFWNIRKIWKKRLPPSKRWSAFKVAGTPYTKEMGFLSLQKHSARQKHWFFFFPFMCVCFFGDIFIIYLWWRYFLPYFALFIILLHWNLLFSHSFWVFFHFINICRLLLCIF